MAVKQVRGKTDLDVGVRYNDEVASLEASLSEVQLDWEIGTPEQKVSSQVTEGLLLLSSFFLFLSNY